MEGEALIPTERGKRQYPLVARLGAKRTKTDVWASFMQAVRLRNEALPLDVGVRQGFRGLLDGLRDTFYPQYVHVKRGRSSSSLERGCAVDDHVSYFVKHGCWPTTVKVDPYAVAAIGALLNDGYRPLATQVRLYDESTKVSTYADIMGIHVASGKIFLAELKTGFEVGYHSACPSQPTMEPPLVDISAASANQHQLQVGIMAEFCVKNYGVNPKWNARCFVLLVNRKGVRFIPLKAWFRNHRDTIMEKLSNRAGATPKAAF